MIFVGIFFLTVPKKTVEESFCVSFNLENQEK